VKELILLDCINTYYYKRRNLLSDDEYNELKDSLSWEGSVAVTLSSKEAHFISAVSAFRRYRVSLHYDKENDSIMIRRFFIDISLTI